MIRTTGHGRVLVAGVGNVLLSDDGFGVEVIRRVAHLALPRRVRVVDYGVRALHLAYELLDGYESLILVDAMSRGDEPGTLFVLDPDLADPDASPEEGSALDPHGLHPAAVLRMAVDLGARLGMVRVVGCQPASLEEGMGLSAPVELAVDRAVRVVSALISAATSTSSKEDDHVEEEAAHPSDRGGDGHAGGGHVPVLREERGR